jgi:ABC-type sugar transport system ATPase subunit
MLRLKQISKSFPGVQALSQVDFEVEAGEIHALVGENGAGKSTLTKIIAGAYQPDAGHIELDGAAVRWDSPADAKRRGIHVICSSSFPNCRLRKTFSSAMSGAVRAAPSTIGAPLTRRTTF